MSVKVLDTDLSMLPPHTGETVVTDRFTLIVRAKLDT